MIPGSGYFPESGFANNFTGGAGGGAGGSGQDGASAFENGGSGGAGGGGIIIIAKGIVNISGNITANGGNGVIGDGGGNNANPTVAGKEQTHDDSAGGHPPLVAKKMKELCYGE